MKIPEKIKNPEKHKLTRKAFLQKSLASAGLLVLGNRKFMLFSDNSLNNSDLIRHKKKSQKVD